MFSFSFFLFFFFLGIFFQMLICQDQHWLSSLILIFIRYSYFCHSFAVYYFNMLHVEFFFHYFFFIIIATMPICSCCMQCQYFHIIFQNDTFEETYEMKEHLPKHLVNSHKLLYRCIECIVEQLNNTICLFLITFM